jgi:hypothetical protein
VLSLGVLCALDGSILRALALLRETFVRAGVDGSPIFAYSGRIIARRSFLSY